MELVQLPIPFEIVVRSAEDPNPDPMIVYLVRPRPEKRKDCLPGGINSERPCPWVSCAQHFAHAFPDMMNDPEFSVSWLEQTCVLDVVEGRGLERDSAEGISTSTIARLLGVERKDAEKVLQIAMGKVKLKMPDALVEELEDGGPETWDWNGKPENEPW